MKKANAYTDGSYNKSLGIYGCGAVLLIDGEAPQVFHETGRAAAASNGWNINGEIRAAEMVIEKAILAGVTDLIIHHDYEGVGKWPDHQWRANKDYTIRYAAQINKYREKINIRFSWVKGHSGNKWNDLVDQAAKYGAKIINTPPTLLQTKIKLSSSPRKSPDILTETGRENLRRFLKIDTPSFKDYAALKTGGKDRFSELKQAELEPVIGPETCNYIRESIHDPSGYVPAMRWVMRGLTPEEASHKVNVDLEISANAQEAN